MPGCSPAPFACRAVEIIPGSSRSESGIGQSVIGFPPEPVIAFNRIPHVCRTARRITEIHSAWRGVLNRYTLIFKRLILESSLLIWQPRLRAPICGLRSPRARIQSFPFPVSQACRVASLSVLGLRVVPAMIRCCLNITIASGVFPFIATPNTSRSSCSQACRPD